MREVDGGEVAARIEFVQRPSRDPLPALQSLDRKFTRPFSKQFRERVKTHEQQGEPLNAVARVLVTACANSANALIGCHSGIHS